VTPTIILCTIVRYKSLMNFDLLKMQRPKSNEEFTNIVWSRQRVSSPK